MRQATIKIVKWLEITVGILMHKHYNISKS
jgi:hypothetical protein